MRFFQMDNLLGDHTATGDPARWWVRLQDQLRSMTEAGDGTRFFMPPESSLGILSSAPLSPTTFKLLGYDAGDFVRRLKPVLSNKGPRFPHRSELSNAPDWKTMPSGIGS